MVFDLAKVLPIDKMHRRHFGAVHLLTISIFAPINPKLKQQ